MANVCSWQVPLFQEAGHTKSTPDITYERKHKNNFKKTQKTKNMWTKEMFNLALQFTNLPAKVLKQVTVDLIHKGNISE